MTLKLNSERIYQGFRLNMRTSEERTVLTQDQAECQWPLQDGRPLRCTEDGLPPHLKLFWLSR